MATKNEIKAEYLALHNALGTREDAIDKDLFDQQHAQIWANCDIDLKARKAELKAKATLTIDESVELRELQALFPLAPPPPLSFETYTHGLPDRVARIEEFLKGAYP